MKPRSTKQGSQSGRSGGGKGRKEEVRGSGIYPGSGPLPPGPAKVETPGSFGHRAPAAARRRGPAREALATRLTQYPQEIDADQWPEFLDDFSREHEGWESEIRVFLADDSGRIETRGLPFEGISIDYKANECTTTVSAGAEAADHLQRLVPGTTRIIALTRDELEIDAADHSRTLVRCRRTGR